MKKILIANRGEIASRITKTCREMGLTVVAVASEADLTARHAREADICYPIGPAPVAESYLRIDAILEVAEREGVDAIHPGFGFLSENAAFARAVRDAGLVFVGPTPEVIELMGSKQAAKARMVEAGVPVVPGYNGENQDPDHLFAEAEKVGYPLLIKASAGGGGKGMRVVRRPDRFLAELETAKREAKSAFGDETVLLERYLEKPRHVEIQVIGDHHGHLVHLYERECSIQRRHQKILEETPSPGTKPEVLEAMVAAALDAAKAVGYTNAGTVELMLDEDDSFYFLEMNTRLQVEHPITEAVTGLDLVRWQLMVADGRPLPLTQDQIISRGHAIEVRIYAEDPARGFMPQTGEVLAYHEPEGLGIRVDSGIGAGDEISIYYDPMIAKLIAWGADRNQVREKLDMALASFCVHGLHTNIAFLRAILRDEDFIAGNTTTDFLARRFPEFRPSSDHLDVALALTFAAREPERSGPGGETVAAVDPWTSLSGWRGGA